MKKLIISFAFVFIQTAMFASPFGLKMGMTIEEIAEQCEGEPVSFKNGRYLIKPIKKHPLFENYVVYVDEKTGLYEIRAASTSIKTNKYGTEIQNAFHSVKDRIAKTYGKAAIYDEYKDTKNSYYQDAEFWFYSLREGSRILSAVWGDKRELTDDLERVILECMANKNDYLEGEAHLALYYSFTNASDVEDEQDSVF